MTDPAAEIAETASAGSARSAVGREDAIALSMGGFALAFVAGEVEDGAPLSTGSHPQSESGRGMAFERLVNIYLANTKSQSNAQSAPSASAHSIVHISYCVYRNWRRSFLRAALTTPARGREGIPAAGKLGCRSARGCGQQCLAGRLDQARKAMARLREIDPTLRFPISGRCSRFADRKTSRGTKRA